MTNKEAIVHMEEIRPKKCKMVDGRLQGGFPDHDSDAGQAIDMAIDAIGKQVPKKPMFSHNLSDTLSVFRCECGNAIKVSHDVGIMNNNNAPNYCSKCGCRLDWSEDND